MGIKMSGRIEDLFESDGLNLAVERAARRLQDRLLAWVREYTPVSHAREDAGGVHLRDTWERGELLILSDGRVRVSVLTHDPKAPHVEYPTRPHRISPRADRAPASVIETGRARGGTEPFSPLEVAPPPALRFTYDGEVVYSAHVEIPASQGVFMMHRAIEKVRHELEQIVRSELGKYMRSGARSRVTT